MEVRLVRIWASPSTLHLRLLVLGRGNAWHKFTEIHVPISELSWDDLASLMHSEPSRQDGWQQPGLF